MKGLSVLVCTSLLIVGCRAPRSDETVVGDPITATATVLAEVAIDSPIISTTGLNASEPAVAFDGANYLVVWSDARDHRSPDLWAARVAGDGSVIDTLSFPIATTPGTQMRPAVTFDGTQYVVVWEDYKAEMGVESDIRAALVSTTGDVTVLGAVSGSSANETLPAIESNGNGALVAWIENGQVVGSMLSGTTFGPTFALTTGAEAKRDPAIDSIPGGNYLVVYTQVAGATADDTYGQFVAPSSSLVGGAITISNSPVATRNPSVSFDGTNFNVVFSSYFTGVDIYGTRVTPGGAVLDTHAEGSNLFGGTLIYAGDNYQETPSIACTPAGCLVTWQDKRNLSTTGFDVFGQMISTSMTAVGSDFAISTADLSQLQARAVVGAGTYFVVWRDARAGGNAALKIGSTRVSTTGVVASPTGELVNRGYNSQFNVALARNGSTIAIGWNDARSLWGDDIMSTRITTAGTIIDVQPSTVSNGLHAQVETAVAAMGSQFLYAWSDNRDGHDTDIFVARTDAASGALLDAIGINLSPGYPGQDTTPKIASSGSESLVVWGNTTGAEKVVLGAIVDATGLASTPFVISDDAGEQGRPSVAWSEEAGHYVVAWQDSRSSNFDVYAARVTSAGVVLDPTGVLVSGATGRQVLPDLLAIGSDLLVVYQDDRNGNWDIYGTRLQTGSSLAVLDPSGIAITTELAHQTGPSLAIVHGNYFLVAFTDERSVTTNGTDLFGQVVSIAGAVVGSSFAISASTDSEVAASLVAAGSARVAVGYHKHRDDLHANRAVFRLIDVELSDNCDDQGCTPGYWKNHADRWLGISPGDGYDATFAIASSLGSSFQLSHAIKAHGGGESALARHATAGLLNAYGGVPNGDGTTVAYRYSPAQVRAIVQGAYATVDDPTTSKNEHAQAIEAAKDQLADANELGCPLTGTPAVPVP